MSEANELYNYLNERIPGIEVFIGYGSEFDKSKEELAKKQTKRKVERDKKANFFVSTINAFKRLNWMKQEDQYDCLILCDDVKSSFQRALEAFPERETPRVTKYVKNNTSEEMIKDTGVVYMTYIYIEPLQRYTKIGFCNYEKTIESMLTFDNLYIPFRLSKRIYIPKTTEIFDEVLEYCRTSLDIVAGFLNPNVCYPLSDHYRQVYEISYDGDKRTGLAEDVDKVSKLLERQEEYIRQTYGRSRLYARYLCEYPNGEKTWLIHKNIPENWFDLLPHFFKEKVEKAGLKNSSLISSEDRIKLADVLKKHIRERNKIESVVQPIRGSYSTGGINTIAYGLRKIKKTHQKQNVKKYNCE